MVQFRGRSCGSELPNGGDMMALDAPPVPSATLPSPPSSSGSPAESIACDSLETPASLDDSDEDQSPRARPEPRSKRMLDGLHVLNTEAIALRNLAHVYEKDELAQNGFERSIQAIVDSHAKSGKVVVTGVGKSGIIGRKVVATLQSLAIPSVFLHPTEALHGDMGMITPHDTLLFITYSGKTTELLQLLPHLSETLPVILLTSHTRHESCVFTRHRANAILLPAPVVESEVDSFGVAAPTTSTTVALAVGDALAVAAAREVHGDVAPVFARNHPGGAIGAALR